jgi:hypothetical protein
LYDLWALAQAGHIDAEAARLFKRYGPTGGYPEQGVLPRKGPTENEWRDALSHQCVLRVSAAEAHEVVMRAWDAAVRAVLDPLNVNRRL